MTMLPVANLTASYALLQFLKAEEALRLTAYCCPSGIPTIGYGSTSGVTHDDVKNRKTISREEAEERLKTDVNEAVRIVRAAVKVPLTQNQFDALVSFVFNVGPGSKDRGGFVRLTDGRPSTLLRKLNERDYQGAAAQFVAWVKGTNPRTGDLVVLPGLVKRRKAEQTLFSTA